MSTDGSESLIRPKLRWPIELSMEKAQEQEVLLVRCPLGVSPQPLALVAAVAPIVSCFEGQYTVAQIAEKFSQYGVTQKLVLELATLLDQHLFLETPRFFQAQNKIHSDYHALTVRPAALAGAAYAAQATDLREEVELYLRHSEKFPLSSRVPVGVSLAGLVAPHIDYRRGQICYGVTYNALRSAKPDIVIVIGTSHQYSRRLFHLTQKDFETPLGVLACDRVFVNELAHSYGVERSYADEILHRNEHSLELQLPFLVQLIEPRPMIVPILVGSFHHMLPNGKEPSHYEEYEAFVEALSASVRRRRAQGLSVCVVAGVDMAHIGKNFGDTQELSTAWMEQIAERDRIYLAALEGQNKSALFAHIAEDEDKRRVCGFPTMYTVLDLFDRLGARYHAQTFDYRQAVDYERQCAVTFAGMGLYC